MRIKMEAEAHTNEIIEFGIKSNLIYFRQETMGQPPIRPNPVDNWQNVKLLPSSLQCIR